MFQRDVPKKQSVDEEPDHEGQKLYNLSQVFLVKYLIHTGVITSAEEYAEKYAEVFHLLATGTLETQRRINWDSLRAKVKKIQDGAVDQIKSFKIFDEE